MGGETDVGYWGAGLFEHDGEYVDFRFFGVEDLGEFGAEFLSFTFYNGLCLK